MNVNELNHLFSHPNEVSRANFSDIRDLLAAYPFVSTFHLLYQKGLSNENDVICDSELHRTALFSPDRNRLMLLLMPKPAEAAVAEQPAVKPTVKVENLVGNEPVKPAVAKPLTKVSDAIVTKPAAQVSVALSTPETEMGERATEEPNTMRFGAEVDAFLSHFESAQASRKAQVADDAPVKVQRVNAQPEADDGDDDDEPVRKPIPANDEAPATEFFTETLAKIYIKQEKFQKAIHIFEELCVRCPEKKEYFTEQIRFLQKLIMYL